MSSARDKQARSDDANDKRAARIAANETEWSRGMVEGMGLAASIVMNVDDCLRIICDMRRRFPELADREIKKRDL